MKGLDGTVIESKIKLDYNKGLFWQMLEICPKLSWDEYVQFINEPKHLVNPVRDIKLFDNPILEALTSTPWYLIPICYFPIIAYCFWRQIETLSLTSSFGCVFLGMLWWTFAEYYLHRFVFHSEDYWLPNIPRIFAFHFMLHGIHHAFPMDRLRLVFPPVPGYAVHFFLIITPMSYVVPP